jgi:hypothetical protein
MSCSSGEEHCCHLGRKGICPFLRENEGGRRWACALKLELGDWSLVHQDERYLSVVRSEWDKTGTADCGDYPPPGKTCPVCGEVG